MLNHRAAVAPSVARCPSIACVGGDPVAGIAVAVVVAIEPVDPVPLPVAAVVELLVDLVARRAGDDDAGDSWMADCFLDRSRLPTTILVDDCLRCPNCLYS